MKKYSVKITDSALIDMEDIYNYIAFNLLSPESARGQYNRIADAILSLDSLPERYRIFDMEPEHSLEIRRMAIDNYLVCYVIKGFIVTVIAVLYGASDVHSRLEKRNY